jgi:hypothetical protein
LNFPVQRVPRFSDRIHDDAPRPPGPAPVASR